jgi:hypothetical protein
MDEDSVGLRERERYRLKEVHDGSHGCTFFATFEIRPGV